MAGDWIKMRPSLLTSPKVNGIARELERDPSVSRVLATGFNGEMSEIVTRSVMRSVTIGALLVIWGAANEHTKDGIFRDADLSDIDDMVGIPGFGRAMEAVGWLAYDKESVSVTLPNFSEYNTTGQQRSGSAKTAAQRQKEYRDRKKAQEAHPLSDVTQVTTSYVTSDVTSNRREEKRREESKQEKPFVSHDSIVFDGSSFQNVNGHLATWQAAYPAIGIKSEMAKAAAWLVANPKNKKSNYARFLNNWFSRAQDKAPPAGGGQKSDDPCRGAL